MNARAVTLAKKLEEDRGNLDSEELKKREAVLTDAYPDKRLIRYMLLHEKGQKWRFLINYAKKTLPAS